MNSKPKVYVTRNGTRYHKTKKCLHLRYTYFLDLVVVSVEMAEGIKTLPCKTCFK